jgi:hypothetical protein
MPKEFLVKDFREISKQFGVEFKITGPLHEENGKVERIYLTIDSKVRAWLKIQDYRRIMV